MTTFAEGTGGGGWRIWLGSMGRRMRSGFGARVIPLRRFWVGPQYQPVFSILPGVDCRARAVRSADASGE